MTKSVVCTTLMIEVRGPMDASTKRIRFVEDILRNSICTLDRDFPQKPYPANEMLLASPRTWEIRPWQKMTGSIRLRSTSDE